MKTSFDEMTQLCAESIDEVLQLQADIFWGLENPIIRQMLRDFTPKTAVEIGVGNAYYLAKLSAKYPKCSFLGVDINKPILEKAEKWLKKNRVANITLKIASFTELGQKNYFDLVFTRLTLQYLPTQVDQYFKKAFQILKPGGILLVFEPADYYFQFPPEYPVTKKMFTVLTGFIGVEGRNVSRTFTKRMETAGFVDIEYQPCFGHQYNCGENYFLLLYIWGVFTYKIKPDQFTAEDLARLKAELEKAKTAKGFMCPTPLLCVKGKKPAVKRARLKI
jgi:ubiquinone/menaquinone biosynthesis C-methylase UbiE